jgi:hypothetical protein
MSPLTAGWNHLASSTRLQRSSQTVSVVGDQAWIFGGELQPRQPIDNQFDVVELSNGMHVPTTLFQVPHTDKLLSIYSC